MAQIALLAASDMEFRILRSLLSDWQTVSDQPLAGIGRCRENSVELYCLGMGPRNAAREIARILKQSEAAIFIVSGFAGALSADVNVGDLIVYQECLWQENGQNETRYCSSALSSHLTVELKRTNLPVKSGLALTMPRVVCGTNEKRRLGDSFQAIAVDMESYQIIDAVVAAGRAVAVVRVISDDLSRNLPDLNAGFGDNDEVNNLGFVKEMCLHPILATHFLLNVRHASAIMRQALPVLLALPFEALTRDLRVSL